MTTERQDTHFDPTTVTRRERTARDPGASVRPRDAERSREGITDRVTTHARVAPPVDVYESQDEILLVADVPGVSADALHVRLEGGELTIEGHQTVPSEGQAPYRPLAFVRSFGVPRTVDAADVTAELNAGVLRLHLRKRPEAKPRRIPVRGASTGGASDSDAGTSSSAGQANDAS